MDRKQFYNNLKMKKIILPLMFFANLCYSQFQSSNIYVQSPSCDYTLSGTWYDTTSVTNSGNIPMSYDSVLMGWKYVFPIVTDYVEICLTPVLPCDCSGQICQTDTPGVFNFYFCNTIDVKEKVPSFKVFPLPVSNLLNIQTDEKIDKVKIFDSFGKLVLTSDDKQLDLTDFASGYYWLEVNSSRRLRITKE